jgi:hypothetical protein
MIEVRELIIRARVDDTVQHNAGNAKPNGNGGPMPKGLSDRDMQKIIALCTEEVMKALKRKTDR